MSHFSYSAKRAATAHEARRAQAGSARLVRMMGTLAPTTIPARWALPRYSSCLANIIPDSRSGTIRISAAPATGELSLLMAAACTLTAVSNANGPSRIPPVICHRSAILHKAAASTVELIFGFTVSIAERIATRGCGFPSACASQIAFCTMSTLSSSVG